MAAMREILALIRASWLTETSYRVNMLLSMASLGLMVVPLFFVANALQPIMAATIASQSNQYFAFALVGATTFTFIAACTSALPSALAAAISRGTFEAYLGTPTPLPALFIGMSGYSILWALVRGILMIAVGLALGVRMTWSGLPIMAMILLLLVLAHAAVGLIAAALLLRFRTTGPLLNGVLTGSALLGGVYYPTHVIPSWLRQVADAFPLSYGLRSLRQVALLGESIGAVGHDLAILAFYVMALLPMGILCLAIALRYARRSGTIGHY
jgi:ABC-2 type transport system permease protein